MTKTQFAPFKPHEAHRAMTPEDAAIFDMAADMLIHPYVAKAILDAGGDRAHCDHFGRTQGTHRPIDAWAADYEKDDVQERLRECAEGLRT